MILADDSTYRYPGHFYVANRQVNVQTGTIIIQGLFPNPGYILAPACTPKSAPVLTFKPVRSSYRRARCLRPRVNIRSL